MQEIKFRGKHWRDGEWRYGSSKYTDETIVSTHIISLAMFWRDVECGVIIPETVGQFINAKDRDRKDIYQGDLVSIYGEGSYEVFWHGNTCKWCITGHTGITWGAAGLSFKVIGNIHDKEVKS